MAASEAIPIADGILEWARRTAGYDVNGAAKKLTVTPDRLQSWESGTVSPTISQLRHMSKLYRRPLAVLLLPEPPLEFEALRDFRKLSDAAHRAWSPALHAEYKRALTQHEVVLELLELSPASVVESTFNLHLQLADGVEDSAARLRGLLGMNGWSRSVRSDARIALKTAIETVENLGVLVIQTRDVEIAEMRGMSISEWPYPVVLLNGSDWPRPRLFSLLHELVHLSLNASSLCDLHEVGVAKLEVDEIENFCNQVAAATLMPRKVIEADPSLSEMEWTVDSLYEISSRYGASSEAFLLRLISLNLAGWSVYRDLKPLLDAKYTEARKAEKDRLRQAKGGPSYYTIKTRNLGPGYVHSVLDAFQSRAISSFDVVDYLDVKFHQLPKLREALG